MTFILNLSAIILLIAILLIRYLFSFLSPDLDNFFHPYSWLIFYVISGIGEVVKLRGRIFWIPMWLIGFIGVTVSSYRAFQESGFYTAIAILLILYFIGFIVLMKLTKINWTKAKDSLIQIKTNTVLDKVKLYKSAFFVPRYLNPDNSLQYMIFEKVYQIIYNKWMSSPEINTHYCELVDNLKNHISEKDYNRYVAVFRSSLDKLKNKKKEAYLDQHMFENITKLIKTTNFYKQG